MKIKEMLGWLKRYNDDDEFLDLEEKLGVKIREQGYITKDDLIKIIRWKFRKNLIGRRKLVLDWIKDTKNSEIIEITKKAINLKDEKKKIKFLCKIKGVGVSLASCILTFHNPKEYCIFDIHIYDEVFNTDHNTRPKYFSSKPKYYLELLDKLRKLSIEYSLSVRDIEKALFKKNYEESKHKHIFRIHDMSDNNRPRERFLKQGPGALSDAELFAIILRTGSIDENVVDMCNKLIKKYKLENLFDCSLNELQKIKGIGPGKAMQILAMAELGKRYSQSKNPIKKITHAEDVYNYFKYKLKDKKQENFYVLLLNTKNHIIKEELITKGVLDSAIIHPREVFKPAIRNSAAKIILVHNHPSGDPQPSQEDLDITKSIIKTGKQMDIKVLDHVIVGSGEGWWSWVEKKN